MTDTTMILDHYATIVAHQAALALSLTEETKRREGAEAQLQFERDCARLPEYFPESVIAQGWRFERCTTQEPQEGTHRPGAFVLIPTFLPEGIKDLRIPVTFPHFRNEPAAIMRLHNLYQAWHVRVGDSAPTIEGILAPLITAHVESHRQAQASEARREALYLERDRQAQAKELLDARIIAQMDLMVDEATKAAMGELAAIQAEHGWPEGAVLPIAEVTWIEGIDHEGNALRDKTFALRGPTEAHDGTLTITAILGDGLTRQVIVASSIVATDIEWTSVDVLPYQLYHYVSHTIGLEIWSEDGEALLRQGSVARSAKLPGAAIRSLLDMPVDWVESETRFVTMRVTADGFEPFTPQTRPDGDPDALPF